MKLNAKTSKLYNLAAVLAVLGLLTLPLVALIWTRSAAVMKTPPRMSIREKRWTGLWPRRKNLVRKRLIGPWLRLRLKKMRPTGL